MTQLTFITADTDLDALLAPYAAPSLLTDTYTDKAMNAAQKRVQRAILQGKPDTIVNHYRAELAKRAADILLLIPTDEYVLLMHNDTTHKLTIAARKAVKTANRIAAEDAEYDAMMADIPYSLLPYNKMI
jgi:hypothetical protein